MASVEKDVCDQDQNGAEKMIWMEGRKTISKMPMMMPMVMMS